ncbi:MAG: type IX secretion system sortase PorU [Bacteroidetes bacterium]|nr:type IX secretion system sortase PorU [Bacteroidota bacterium]MBU1371733.1 type IX secretion system sortase PorU [Bacteroidota bacterium]MBU1483738.1 type IX secretion system sortase PorU [Bacteroidota bacterium]MBU1761277.1 type IX secretion system sortase PorU [Bacteroidota bacterium]MBU2268081.1 type IX secretion system sortase PorU [Bacteroidota bacterium]
MKGIVNKLLIILIFSFGLSFNAICQIYPSSETINWVSDSIKTKLNLALNSSQIFPRFNPENFGELPLVYLKIPVNNSKNEVRVNIQKLSSAYLSATDNDFQKIKPDIQLNYSTVYEDKKPFLLIQFLPIIKESSSIKKIDEFSIEINAIKENAQLNTTLRAYKSNSVLATGNWYKIAVKEDGIYKLSYDFIKNLGIDVNQINPKNIKIYGNGGVMLPQSNSQPRKDDLQENAIKVIGEEDGKFDAADYVLLYAQGNINWKLNSSNSFEHERNVYSDSSYYFINTDNFAGKRINTITTTSQAPNYITNFFDDHQLYENDAYTLITASIKSGRNWYGEDFEFNPTRNFDFNTPALDGASPVFLKTAMALRSNVNSSVSVKLNNQTLYSLTAAALPLTFETDFARPVSNVTSLNGISGNSINVSILYNKPNSSSNTWLDYLELNCRRKIDAGSFLTFRDKKSVGASQLSSFNLVNTNASTQVWDITNPLQPLQQTLILLGSDASFTTATPNLKEFVVFGTIFKTPTAIGKIQNQNLHALAQADMIIVSAPKWFSEAKRLADFRKSEQNLSYQIVTPEQIFNEFSSGARDATAIRDFVKMFYDRAGSNPNLMPKYLLLFGTGSFDNRMIKFKDNNFVVTYQSENSLSPTQSYTSDDYYALLDDNEGAFPEDFVTNPGLLDVAVGRIPVKSLDEARNVVDKLIAYSSTKSLGEWRNQFVIVADDEDNNLHLNQAEANAAVINQRSLVPDIDKIYFDAYQQQSVAGGNRYPEVEEALNQKFNNGVLLINYTGHGGESGWAEERVLTLNDINSWNNSNKLPIIFTATCSFSRWDDPEITSAGELTLLKKSGGVPALFSTTRIVFASYNFDLNQSFLRAMFSPTLYNKRVSFGDVFKAAKNNNIGGLNINSRNFTLLGDPSTLFPTPVNNVKLTSVNNHPSTVQDTLKAGAKVMLGGVVNDSNGNKMTNFNGFVYPLIYDKPTLITTLGQDKQVNGSYAQSFKLQKNILYKGKASVKNGDFSFDFIVPKDINFQVGKGKISFYADNSLIDASGSFTDINVGDISSDLNNDKIGPEIHTYLNDKNFVSGGITNTTPILLINLKDASGINTSGIGIGHDIVFTLSSLNQQDKSIILNQYYQAKVDSYQEGTISYPISALSPDFYSLKVKAWDVFNNSSEQTITFEVKTNEKLTLAHVLNYPNPFTTKTSFQFEHNHPNEDLEVQINIRTVSGKLIKTINQLINSPGNRVTDIFWDGKDNFGEKIGRGVYIYELKVRSNLSGDSFQKIEKLVLL